MLIHAFTAEFMDFFCVCIYAVPLRAPTYPKSL